MLSSRRRLVAVFILLLLALPALPSAAQAQSSTATAPRNTGKLYNFTLVPFNDTLFTAIDEAYRVAFDDQANLWYSSPGGLVHVDIANKTRTLYTHMEGLPESVALGVAVHKGKVYVGTDLGLAVLDPATGVAQPITVQNSPLPVSTVTNLEFVGDNVWMGTNGGGVAIWNTTMPASDASAWKLLNTSAADTYPASVNRITAFDDVVYVTTEGHGLWRFDRDGSNGNLTRYTPDGLISYTTRAVARMNGLLYIGTDRGVQVRNESRLGQPGEWGHVFNKSMDKMVDQSIQDLDVIPTTNGTPNLFVSTRQGVWQYDPQTGLNQTLSDRDGILGAVIYDLVYDEARGWAFAGPKGVSLLRNDGWRYFASGPTNGPTNAPLSFGMTSAFIGDNSGYLWFGTPSGVAVYRAADVNRPGRWINLGPFQGFGSSCGGGTVNQIDVVGNVSWIASNGPVLCAFNRDDNTWSSRYFNGTNYIYAVEQSGSDLWVPLFGNGLYYQNLTTKLPGITFSKETLSLPDDALTDLRVQGSNVWLGSSVGVIQFDAATKHTVNTFTTANGVPGNGIVFRVLPDGAVVWVGTQNGGVAKLDLISGRVTSVWNAVTTPGFPGGQVRALYREGGRLWVGTQEGLARVDVATGQFRAWNGTNGLVASIVNGINSQDGILYIATLNGVNRMDIASGKIFPMVDSPTDVRASSLSSHASGAGAPIVRVSAPTDGTAVTGLVDITGTASAFGATITSVQVQVGDGPWETALGTDSWTYTWDTTTEAPNQQVLVRVRAFAGNATSAPAELLLTPVQPPKTPLSVEAFPPARAIAGRALVVTARVQGDDPLSAVLLYRMNDTPSYRSAPMSRSGSLFSATIAGAELTPGTLSYYVQARSGLLSNTSPSDSNQPFTLAVEPKPSLGVKMTGPASLDAAAGQNVTVPLSITNDGTQQATFFLSAAGLRRDWIAFPASEVALNPGETRLVNATLRVPDTAFSDNITFTFEARDSGGVAEPSTIVIPVKIAGVQAQAVTTPAPAPTPGRTPLPAGLVLLALAAAAVAAAALRRRRP